ncbi:homoserine dehydrogenase [Candidatus Vesicomyidisocius calyptogenae]|uniref:Homoserine dehydrogenase n=1 Tax=Vesicomyosocius okutanii subsp. Calyptogena okutanii (strain HA) TaxID=412965 RepID=A5CW60_VESOH|nr:homoserine dehydrogenase [Candidatus Vesicomyosocius okutanii]BAF61818.1 homoserine dehydrogenase [Candidatus Vesicomyosocius okutanii]
MLLVNIGILGLGTVGGGVVNVLNKNQKQIIRRSGNNINVTHAAVRDITQTRICPTKNIKLTQDPFQIVNNDDISVVLELMGGVGLAKNLIEQAIKNGKHVVTANKALIATYGNELLALAKDYNTHLLFEAAVAGGIPILKSLKDGLSANQIELVAGIINGTSNFILTEMHNKDRNFQDALKEAKALGYAEANPTFDVEGIDTAHKLAILASMAFGCELQFNQITTEGISNISSEDITYATKLGYTIKHIGIAKKLNDKLQMHVRPTLVPTTHLLSNVNGVMNGILIKGNAVGETLYYGAGAGDEATASSVIADLIDIIRNTANHDIFGWKSLINITKCNTNSIASIFYLRLLVTNKSGIVKDIKKTLANYDINIEAILQKKINQKNDLHIALITNLTNNSKINKAVTDIQKYDYIIDEIKIIFVETLN